MSCPHSKVTYPHQVAEGVVDVGTPRQKETAPRTELVKEEQLLVLRIDNQRNNK